MSNGPPAQRRRCSRKKTEAPTPSFFGLMHRNIGALHQATHIVAVMRIKGDANAWCRTQRMAIDQIGLRYAAQNFVGDHGGIIRSLPFPQTQLTLAAGKTAKCPLQINGQRVHHVEGHGDARVPARIAATLLGKNGYNDGHCGTYMVLSNGKTAESSSKRHAV